MWGTPGTLVAARAMLEWTGDERWREACADGCRRALVAARRRGLLDAAPPRRGVQGARDAPTASSATSRRCGPLLDDERRAAARAGDERVLLARAASSRTGSRTGRTSSAPELQSAAGEIRLQWCCGAPGIVVAAADYLDEELLLAGAELVWQAGPPTLEKGAGICHGTAGNGYALLAAFERTGDELWLDRARRFAAHALGQVERRRRALLALDGRRRRRRLRRRLPRRTTPLPVPRLNPGLARERERLAVVTEQRGAGVELAAVLAERPRDDDAAARPPRGAARISAVIRPSTTSPRPGPPTA